MQELFTEEFTDGHFQKKSFTVYQVAANLFQAKNDQKIIVLWKSNNNWEGATNGEDDVHIVPLIGAAIEKFLNKEEMHKK